MANGYKAIRQAMRQNEVDLLKHLRNRDVTSLCMFGRAWMGAMERLEASKMVKYDQNFRVYKARKGARPVTPVVH